MSERRPTLVVFCGLPFSGKSTLARELAARTAMAHVEIDRINTERCLGLDGSAIDPADWDITYLESFRRIESHLIAGQSVIHDATNYTRSQRDHLRAIAHPLGVRTVIVYVAVPVDEVWRRWTANRSSGARVDVRDEDFENVVISFEPPADDEGVVIHVGGPDSLEELIELL